MRRKHWRKLFATSVAYLFLWSCGTSTNVWAAASGNYTDLLPVGAPANTTVISNGSGWSLTTLAPTQTFGDSLSRAPMTAFQIYTSSTIATTVSPSTWTALAGQSSVGSATIPAGWFALGRSIRINARGWYGTTGTPNWTWAVLIGTTSILTTGAVAAPVTQTQNWWTASALITISTSSTVSHGWAALGSYDILVASGAVQGTAANVLTYSTNTISAVNVDLTTSQAIQPVFTWGTSSASNKLTITNLVIELLN